VEEAKHVSKKEKHSRSLKPKREKASRSRRKEQEEEDADATETDVSSDSETESEAEEEEEDSYIVENSKKKKKKKKTTTTTQSDGDSKFKRPLSVILPEEKKAAAMEATGKRLSHAEKAALRRIHDRAVARRLSGRTQAKVDDLHFTISSAEALHKFMLMEINPEACFMYQPKNNAGENEGEKKKSVHVQMARMAVKNIAVAGMNQLINHVLPLALNATICTSSIKKASSGQDKEEVVRDSLEKARLNNIVNPRAIDAAMHSRFLNNPALLRHYRALCADLDAAHKARVEREHLRSQPEQDYIAQMNKLKKLDEEETALKNAGGLSQEKRAIQIDLKLSTRRFERSKAQAKLERAQKAITNAEESVRTAKNNIPTLEEEIAHIEVDLLPDAMESAQGYSEAFEAHRKRCNEQAEKIKKRREKSQGINEEDVAWFKKAEEKLKAMRELKKLREEEWNQARNKIRVLNNTVTRKQKSMKHQEEEIVKCKERVLRNKEIVSTMEVQVKDLTSQINTLKREKTKNGE
jgi:hypothetical protein